MDPIIKRLLENHQVEDEHLEDIPQVEEEIEEQEEVSTEEEDETLEEDWRSGTFDEKDLVNYEKKMIEDARRLVFSLTSLEKKHPQYKDIFQRIRSDIKRMF